MGRDESGTLARLREHRRECLEPTLARYGGRLVKLTGDGALVEFASACDALSAAIEFQQAVNEVDLERPEPERIIFRIGLHLGDMIVEGDDLYGDGVNIAARLETQAPAGGILVSRTVFEAVAGRLKATFADLGNLALKNIERPIQAFSVKWEPSDWRRPPSLSLESSSEQGQPSSAELLALPDKPSIAVLPFQNLSVDPKQEYFADGIVEDITTALSRFQVAVRDRSQFELCLQGSLTGHPTGQTRARCALRAGRERAKSRKQSPHYWPAHRQREWRSYLGRPTRRGTKEYLRASGSGYDQGGRGDCTQAQSGEVRRSLKLGDEGTSASAGFRSSDASWDRCPCSRWQYARSAENSRSAGSIGSDPDAVKLPK